jgi:hypothetical protein
VTTGMESFLGRLEHRAEGLKRQRALLRREVRSEEQHRKDGTGLVPAPKAPPRLGRGAVVLVCGVIQPSDFLVRR